MRDFILFLKERKKWLLLPVVLVLLAVAGLVLLAGSSAISPFIYTIF